MLKNLPSKKTINFIVNKFKGYATKVCKQKTIREEFMINKRDLMQIVFDRQDRKLLFWVSRCDWNPIHLFFIFKYYLKFKKGNYNVLKTYVTECRKRKDILNIETFRKKGV